MSLFRGIGSESQLYISNVWKADGSESHPYPIIRRPGDPVKNIDDLLFDLNRVLHLKGSALEPVFL